jgi:hypothetical protein
MEGARQVSGLDFDFWRKERERVLSKPFNDYFKDLEVGNYFAAIDSILEMEEKPLEGDGLTMARCEGCGGLSLVMLKHGKPIAYVCPPDRALLELARIIAEEVFPPAKKPSIIELQ